MPTMTLEVQLFGPPEALVNGVAIPRLRSKKGLWALGILVLRGAAVSRESLAAALWPKAQHSEGLANLRPLLSELRRALGEEGERLQSPDRGTLVFDLQNAQIDVARFDREVAHAETLDKAIGLYRGPLMEGCPLEVVVREREARESACLRALSELVRSSPPEKAVGFARRAVEIAPLRDEPRRALMRAMASGGDLNAALEAYRDFVRLLSRERGAVPDRRTRGLYDELRAGASSPKPARPAVGPTPNNLPRLLDGLMGREDERSEIVELLKASQVVTLVGMGGIGKTRLALAVAERSLKSFPQGVWFVPLDRLTDERDVAPSIAQAIGAQGDERRPTLDAILQALGEGPALLVLDNCEHVLDSASRVAAFLVRAKPSLRVLATSRQPLGLPNEVAWSVPPLASPERAILPEGRATLKRVVLAFESVRLFLERAQAAEPRFKLGDDNVLAVADICSSLEGIPLALELAATRVRSIPIDALAERLRESRLESLHERRGSGARQATLRATLDWSYALLAPGEASLFRRLCVFIGGWTLEAAGHVCHDRSQTAVASALGSLVGQSFVVYDRQTGRYRMLEMVRLYGFDKLREAGESEAAQADHLAWVDELTSIYADSFRGPDPQAATAILKDELPNVRAALEWEGADAAACVRVAAKLASYFAWNGRYAEGIGLMQRVIGRDRAPKVDADHACCLCGAASLAFSIGDLTLARSFGKASLEQYEKLADDVGIVRASMAVAVVALQCGDHQEARLLFERSLEIGRRLEDWSLLAHCLYNYGFLLYRSAQPEAALVALEECFSIHLKLGGRQVLAWPARFMGTILWELGRYPEGRALIQESLGYLEGSEDHLSIAYSLEHAAQIDVESGRSDDALPLLEEAMSRHERIGKRSGIGRTYVLKAEALRRKGRYPEAAGEIAHAIRIRRELGDHIGLAEAVVAEGRVLFGLGRVEEAEARLREGLRLSLEARFAKSIAEALEALAALDIGRRSVADGVGLLGTARSIREEARSFAPPAVLEELHALATAARSALGEIEFEKAWRRGQAACKEYWPFSAEG